MMNIIFTYAQTKGVVLDSDNNPIEGATIFLADQKILINSDEKGIYLFNQELSKNSYINIYKHGFSSKIIQYKTEKDLEVILERLHVALDEIGVTENFSELGNNKLTSIEKKSIQFLSSNSMVESITQLNGVDIISSGLGIQKIVVRGLSGMRVVTYLNGMKIDNQQWANDHGIGFTDLGLDEVELIKGSSALKYGGEAIGGLLFFKDFPFISGEKTKGFVSTKFNNSSYLSSSQFGLKLNKQNFYLNIYGQYSISSDYRLPNNWYLYNSRFKQNAIKFSLAHKYKRWQNIFRGHFHNEITGIPAHLHTDDPASASLKDITSSSLDFFNPKSYEDARPSQFIANQLFTYQSNYLLDNIKFSFNAGHFINNLKEYEGWTKPAFDLTIESTQLMPNIRYHLHNLTFNVGAQISFLNNKNNIEDRLIPDANSQGLGLYTIIDYEKNNFGFNSAFRYDYNSLIADKLDYDAEFSGASYSSGVYYTYSDNIFRLTYSSAFRSPHISELFSDGIHHGTNRYEIGNNNLNIEYANQIDFKYQWSNEHLGFVFNPFIQSISDFISIDPTGDYFYKYNNFGDIIASYPKYNYVQYDKVELRGIEMNIHYHPHQLHNLHIEQSYTFMQTENKSSAYGLALTPANNIKSIAKLDFEEYQNLLKYKLHNFSFHHIYTFKQESIAEYEEITKAYNIFNIQLGLKFNKKFKALIGVNNLLNKEYSPHISRVRGVAGGVPNPGRHFYINLKYDF